jgi:hypothetical protein
VVFHQSSFAKKKVKQALLIFLEIGKDRNVVEPGQSWLVLTHDYTVKHYNNKKSVKLYQPLKQPASCVIKYWISISFLMGLSAA